MLQKFSNLMFMQPMSIQAIIRALQTVQDPDLKQDIVSLGMVQAVQVVDHQVSFVLVLTTPACPLQEVLKQACVEAIHAHVDHTLTIHITCSAQVTKTQQATQSWPNIKNIIAVAAGKGGVGKSTIAANVATSLAQQGAVVGLLDADIFGPSIPIMFGCGKEKPLIEQQDHKKYMVPLVKHGVQLMSIGFLTQPGEAIIWRGPMASSALRQLLYDTLWHNLDYLFVDLPPGTSDIQLTLVQAITVTGILVVTTPQQIALADVMKCIDMFQKSAMQVPMLGLIENMSYFIPEGSTDSQPYYPFGHGGGKKLAHSYQIPFLGEIPLTTALMEASDSGIPAATQSDRLGCTFKDIASKLAQQITIQNLKLVSTYKDNGSSTGEAIHQDVNLG